MSEKMLAELRAVLRCFTRDNTTANRFDRAMGTGVRVFITYTQANRIYQLVKEIENENRQV